MPATINGQAGAFLQPIAMGKTESGSYTTYVWEGTKQSILGQIAVVDALGGTWDYQDSPTLAKCRLTARIPLNVVSGDPTTDVVDDWEYFSHDSEVDILKADIASVNSITDTDKSLIRKAIQAPPGGPSPAVSSGSASDIYLLMLTGVREMRISQPILRHTKTVTRAYQVKAARTNVKKIISTANIGTLEGIPAAVLFQLPTDVSTRDGLVYGWYKKEPSVRLAARQKIRIEQEWEYGLWSTLLYGAAI
jgi:hypothetical protein